MRTIVLRDKDKSILRVYVDCPLRINEFNVGVICLIDNKPRLSQEIDQETVYDVAQMVEEEMRKQERT